MTGELAEKFIAVKRARNVETSTDLVRVLISDAYADLRQSGLIADPYAVSPRPPEGAD